MFKDFFGSLLFWYNGDMNDDQLNDLKQFIASTVSQATANMATKDDVTRLEQKVDDGFAGIAKTVEQITEQLNDRDKSVDQRFTKLEQHLA